MFVRTYRIVVDYIWSLIGDERVKTFLTYFQNSVFDDDYFDWVWSRRNQEQGPRNLLRYRQWRLKWCQARLPVKLHTFTWPHQH